VQLDVSVANVSSSLGAPQCCCCCSHTRPRSAPRRHCSRAFGRQRVAAAAGGAECDRQREREQHADLPQRRRRRPRRDAGATRAAAVVYDLSCRGGRGFVIGLHVAACACRRASISTPWNAPCGTTRAL
jgi:hypothetical protein